MASDHRSECFAGVPVIGRKDKFGFEAGEVGTKLRQVLEKQNWLPMSCSRLMKGNVVAIFVNTCTSSNRCRKVGMDTTNRKKLKSNDAKGGPFRF